MIYGDVLCAECEAWYCDGTDVKFATVCPRHEDPQLPNVHEHIAV